MRPEIDDTGSYLSEQRGIFAYVPDPPTTQRNLVARNGLNSSETSVVKH